ncbi:MAG TPA: tetratricopeptide repeat protein [Burkholderiaceae bacterium]
MPKSSLCTLFRPASVIRALFVAAAVCGAALPALAVPEHEEVDRLMQAGKLDEAMNKAEVFLKDKPRDPQMRFLKGVIQLDTGKRTEAIATFTQLTQDAPELPEPYNNLAVIYASQNQFDKARNALESAIRTNPSYATAQENLGDVYARLASQAYSKALQLDQSNAAVAPKLAVIRTLFTPAAPGAKPAILATTAPEMPRPAPAPGLMPSPVAKAPAPPPATPTSAPALAAVAKAHEASPPANANANAEVESAVRAWAAAWSGQDMERYFAAYSSDFMPAGGQHRKSWEEERRARIVGKSNISVNIENLVIQVDGQSATAKFRQVYRAGSLNISSRKTLEMQRSGIQWHIRKESVGG